MRELHRLPLVGALLSALLLAYGCTASSGGGESACAVRVVFQQQTYTEIANVEFTTGRELGQGLIPDCNDGEDRNAGQSDVGPSLTGSETAVNEVEGLDSKVAVTAEASGRRILFVVEQDGSVLPEAVQDFIGESRS